MSKKSYTDFIFLIILGVMTSLSLPPFNFFIINFLTFTFLFLFLFKKSYRHKNWKMFFIYGWLFGFGYFATSLYWISISLTFDQDFKFLIPLVIILIPAFLSIFYGLVSYLFILSKPNKIVSSLLVFSLLFGIIEFIRGSILTGFPWNLIAYSFVNQLEILNITSIIGTYGFNLFCISLFACPSIAILKFSKKNIGICISFFIFVVFFYIYGNINKEKFNNTIENNYNYKIRIVGSNISLDRFYKNVDTVSILKDLIEISSPIDSEKIIFIWPEGILPNISQKELANYKWLFSENFNKNHILILGMNNQSINNGSKKFFNSFSVYDGELNLLHSYNKINLVPFGEFLPFEKILNKIGLKSLTNNHQSFSKGESREIIEINKKNFSIKVLPLICYEIIYSGKLFNKPHFDVIINISEDGWFGQSIGPKQHFVHSIFRATENGKYVLRSSNNGIAAIINPLGYVEKRVKPGQSGFVDFKKNKKIQPTIFSIYGNKIFGLLILLYIFLIISFNRIKNE